MCKEDITNILNDVDSLMWSNPPTQSFILMLHDSIF